MTLTGLHRATDAAAKRNMEQIVKWSKEEKLGIITKVLRQANWESSTGGGQPVPPGFRDEVIEWILESLPPGEELHRLVLDVSNVLFPFFVNLDRLLYAHHAANRPDWSSLLQERRFLELRKHNAVLDYLIEKIHTIKTCYSIYDHPSKRRPTKYIAEEPRHDPGAKARGAKLVVEAKREYREGGGKGQNQPIPQIDMQKEESRFPAFSPTTPEELRLPNNPTPLQVLIHREATKLQQRSIQIVSRSEADSVCRDASLGRYPHPNYPVHSYQAPSEPSPLPSHSSSNQPSSSDHPSSSRPPSSSSSINPATPTHAKLPTAADIESLLHTPFPNLSLIVGTDSDHQGLNDQWSASYILGLSSSHPSRATDLRKRFKHSSDWGYIDRIAQTIAMVVAGCDETDGLYGYTVAGIARSGREVDQRTPKQSQEFALLDFCNSYVRFFEMYEEVRIPGGQTTITVDQQQVEVDIRGFEQHLYEWFKKFLPPNKVSEFKFSLQLFLSTFLGLFTDQYEVVDKQLWRKAAEERVEKETNRQLEDIYRRKGTHNHPFSSLIRHSTTPKENRRSPPPNLQLNYHLVKNGPDSRTFWQEEKKTAEEVMTTQSQTMAPLPPVKAPPKQKKKQPTKSKPDDDGPSSALREGHGIKKFDYALSAVPLPLKDATIRNLLFPGIPEGHHFHHNLVNVLNSLLNVWLNESPAINETINGILSLYWQFSPYRLVERGSNPRNFGTFVAAVVLECKTYYRKHPLPPTHQPDPLPQSIPPHNPSRFPQWLEDRVVEFLVSVPLHLHASFRQLVAEYRFVEGEFKYSSKTFDLVGAMVLKERRRLRFPPPILTNNDFISLNYTTAGTGLMNASDARGRSLASFLSSNLTSSLLDFSSRIPLNRYNISTLDVSNASTTLSNLSDEVLQDLVPLTQAKSVKRLLRLRFFSAPLPKPSPFEHQGPAEPSTDATDSDSTDDEDVEMFNLEDLLKEDGETRMDWEEEESSDYGDDEDDEEDDEDIAMDASELEKGLEDRIAKIISDAALKQNTHHDSTSISQAAKALAKLLVTSVDFLIKHVGMSFVEATRWIKLNGVKCRRIGDMVMGGGGKEVKFRKKDDFFDIGRKEPEGEEYEEAEEEEDEDAKKSSAKKVLRSIVLGVLPFFGKTFFNFQPRGCDINMPILRSLTNTPPRVSTARDPPDYLPTMILKLTDRLAVDSLVANNSLRNVRFPPFEIPPTTSLPQREPARHTYEEVRKWKEEDSFVKLQAEHPDKILLAAKDHFPHLEFQEEPSSGPFRVVRLTQNGLATAQAQSRTIEAFFDNLDLTAEDLTQVPHEALNWWFKPPIGHRLYHGNFYFNRFEVIPLVYDPRRFTKKGWNKYQGRMGGKPWTTVLEILASEHPKMLAVYRKLETLNSAGKERRPAVGFSEITQPGTGVHQVPPPSRAQKGSVEEAKIDDLFSILRTQREGSKTVLRLERSARDKPSPPVLDDRRGLYLPFKDIVTPTGQRVLEIWGSWILANVNSDPSYPQIVHVLDPLFEPRPSPSPSRPATPAHRPSRTATESSSNSLPPSSFPFDSSGQGNRNTSDTSSAAALPPPSQADHRVTSSPAIGSTSQSQPPHSAPPPASLDQSSLPPSTDGIAPNKRGYLIANDLGRRISVDSILISPQGPIKFFRISSGQKKKQERRAKARRTALLPLDARGRFVKGLQDHIGSTSNDIISLLARLSVDPSRVDSLVDFESLRLHLPPTLQPSLLHVEDYLGSKRNLVEQERRRARLDQQTARQWKDALPPPADGSKLELTLITSYNGITGGAGYGVRNEKEQEDSMIRVLRGFSWVNLLLLRSSEAYSSQVCSKPCCGGALVHPSRLGDSLNSFNLRLVVCIRCFEVGHRDDNAAANIARMALARGRGVRGNILSPDNAKLSGNKFRGEKYQVTRLEHQLRKHLSPLSEEARRQRLLELKEGDSLITLLEMTAVALMELDEDFLVGDDEETD